MNTREQHEWLLELIDARLAREAAAARRKMNANQDHAQRLREVGALIAQSGSARATFGTAYERALVAGLEALLLNERDRQMDTTNNATHARHIRQILDDVRAGRPLNTGGEIQAALEAAAAQLEGGGVKRDLTAAEINTQIDAREVRAGDEQNPPNRVHPPVDAAVGHAPGVVPAVGTVTSHVSHAEPTPAHAAEPAKSSRHK